MSLSLITSHYRSIRESLLKLNRIKNPNYPEDLVVGCSYIILQRLYRLDCSKEEKRGILVYEGIEEEYHKSDGKIDYWCIFRIPGETGYLSNKVKLDISHYSENFPGWYVVQKI